MGMTRSTPVSATMRATASPTTTRRTSPPSARACRAAPTRAFSPAESQNRVRDMSTTTSARPGSANSGPAASSSAAFSPAALARSISSGAVTTGTPSTTWTGKLISGTAPPPGPDRSTTDRSGKFWSFLIFFRTDRGACVRSSGEPSRSRARVGRQADGALQHPGVHESLGQVAPRLALADVVLLGVQAGRAAGRAVALEPAGRRGGVPAGLGDLRHPEPAQQERTLALVQWPRVVAEPVDVPVLGQFVLDRPDGRAVSRVVRGQGAADHRHQQGGVDAAIVGRALPAAGRMDRVAEAAQQQVGQRAPPGRLPVPGTARPPARRAARGHGQGAQAGYAREPGMRPVPVLEFPDARVGLGPALLD